MVTAYRYNIGTRAREIYIKNSLKNLRPNQIILDLGCGTGYFANVLSKKGKVIGLEIEEESLKFAAKKYKNKAKFVVGSGLDLPFKNNSFNVVLTSEVIEHVPDDKTFLYEIKRVLKRNGTLILTTECNEGIFPPTEICHKHGTEHYQDYKLGYKTKELKKLLQDSRFKILDLDYSLVFFSKLFMELIKLIYHLKNPKHEKQSDVEEQTKGMMFKIYTFIFPFFMLFVYLDKVYSKLLKGTCIMTKSRNLK